MDSDSELARRQDPADEETIAKAEEANRLAAEHGVADPGGLLDSAGASGADSGARPMDEAADDVVEELGPPQ